MDDSERDRNYRGPRNEDGYLWDGDFDWYCKGSDVDHYRLWQDDPNSPWQCVYVYLGTSNVAVTQDDILEHKPGKSEQEWYQWLWENRRVNDEGYDEVKHG